MKVLLKFVFLILSVNEVFCAEKYCDVHFLKLEKLASGGDELSAVDASPLKETSILKMSYFSGENEGPIKYLKSELSKKYPNNLIKIYCVAKMEKGNVADVCRGDDKAFPDEIDKEIRNSQEGEVMKLIKSAISDGDEVTVNVYFIRIEILFKLFR